MLRDEMRAWHCPGIERRSACSVMRCAPYTVPESDSARRETAHTYIHTYIYKRLMENARNIMISVDGSGSGNDGNETAGAAAVIRVCSHTNELVCVGVLMMPLVFSNSAVAECTAMILGCQAARVLAGIDPG